MSLRGTVRAMSDTERKVENLFDTRLFKGVVFGLIASAIFIFSIQLVHYFKSTELELFKVLISNIFWKNFLDNFPVPIALLGAMSVFIGFTAFLQRSKLAEEQNELSRKQVAASEALFVTNKLNEQLKLFIEHRNFVFRELEDINLVLGIKHVIKCDARYFYSAVFPQNNHESFKVDREPEALKSLVNVFNISNLNLKNELRSILASESMFTGETLAAFHRVINEWVDSTSDELEKVGVYLSPLPSTPDFNMFYDRSMQLLKILLMIANYKAELDDNSKVLKLIKSYLEGLSDFQRHSEINAEFEKIFD